LDSLLPALLVIHLVSTLILARQGMTSFPLHLPGRLSLVEAIKGEGDVAARMAATELVAMQHNEEQGIRLNNLLRGVELALVWVVTLTIIGAVRVAWHLL